MDKTETIVQLKKLLASKKAADLLRALKKLQRNYFPEFGNTVVDIFEERYKRFLRHHQIFESFFVLK